MGYYKQPQHDRVKNNHRFETKGDRERERDDG